MLMLSSEYREQILEAQKKLLEKCVNALEINDHEGDVEKSGTYVLFIVFKHEFYSVLLEVTFLFFFLFSFSNPP